MYVLKMDTDTDTDTVVFNGISTIEYGKACKKYAHVFPSSSKFTIFKKKSGINEDDLFYVKEKANVYKSCSHLYPKKKILLKCDWVQSYIESKTIDKANIQKTNGRVNTRNAYPLPAKLCITDEEKFKDINGNIFNVDIRGERREDKIFFDAFDVLDMLDIKKQNAHHFITCYSLTFGDDYMIFYDPLGNDPNNDPNNVPNNCISIPKEDSGYAQSRMTFYYLTYKGLLHVFASRRDAYISKHYIAWASRIVFASHFGTTEHKLDVIKNDILCVKNIKYSRDFLNQVILGEYPCLYALKIPNEKISYPQITNGEFIIKYGYTKDAGRRLDEHKRVFGQDCELIALGQIDPQDLSQAETTFKDELLDIGDHIIDIPGQTELFLMPCKSERAIRNAMNVVKNKYSCHYQNLMQQREQLTKQLEMKENNITILEKELRIKDDMLRMKDDMIRMKDDMIQKTQSFNDLIIQEKNKVISSQEKLIIMMNK